jgi:hypothetical protein
VSVPDRTGVESTLTITVDATPQATLAAVRRLDLTRPVNQALFALDLAHRFPLVPTLLDSAGHRPLRIGCIWRIDDADPCRRAAPTEFASFGDPGHVKLCWEIDVTPGEQDTLLSITTRISATDEAARARLLDAWSLVGPLSGALAERAAHAVKAYTEDLEDGEQPGWSRARQVSTALSRRLSCAEMSAVTAPERTPYARQGAEAGSAITTLGTVLGGAGPRTAGSAT